MRCEICIFIFPAATFLFKVHAGISFRLARKTHLSHRSCAAHFFSLFSRVCYITFVQIRHYNVIDGLACVRFRYMFTKSACFFYAVFSVLLCAAHISKRASRASRKRISAIFNLKLPFYSGACVCAHSRDYSAFQYKVSKEQ